jgi:hypothetical protein
MTIAVTNELLDDVAGLVSQYLTHYIDGQATITVTPSMVEAVLVDHDLDQLRAVFDDSANWVASLIRKVAANEGTTA